MERRLTPSLDFGPTIALGASGAFADLKINASALDAAGNLYVTGSFRGTAGFDPARPSSTVASTGNRDAFTASYDSSGDLRRLSIFKGSNASAVGQGTAIGVDSSGNVYVTGSFSGTVDFDPGVGSLSLSTSSSTDIFILKLDAGGGCLWARDVSVSSGGVGEGDALALDADRGVIIAGVFTGTAGFGSKSVTAGGTSDAFVTKLDPQGNFVWTSTASGSGSSSAEMHGLAVDSNGAPVAVGFIKGNVTFDPGGASVLLSPAGYRDAAVWALDASGKTRWARAVGGPDLDQAAAVAIDGQGNLNVVGLFSLTANFGTPSNPVTLTASGGYDPFLLRLSSSGTTLGAFDFALSTNDTGTANGIAIDPAGNLILTGWFTGSLDANPGMGNVPLISAGSADAFVVALDPNGLFLDAERAGGANFDSPFGISANAKGELAIAGTAAGGATFGATTLPTLGTSEVFLTRLLDTIPPPALGPPALTAASDTGASSADRITSNSSPAFDTTGVIGSFQARLYRDGIRIASRTDNGPLTDPGPAADGVHSYTVTQVSPTGAESPASSPTLVTIDTAPPAAPSGLALPAADDTGTIGDGITSVVSPRFQGMSEPGATVILKTEAGFLVGSTTAGSDGRFSIGTTNPFAEGSVVLIARATDAAGNVGPGSAGFTLVIVTTKPLAPSMPVLLAADDSGTKGDSLTNIARPRFTGTAGAGQTVRLIDGLGRLLGQGTADGSGRFQIQLASAASDGLISVAAQAVDVAGNVGPAGASLRLTIDTSAPSAPSPLALLPADDSGTKNDRITNVKSPRLTGTAEPGATVTIRDSRNVFIAQTSADGSGQFSATVSSSLADGIYTLTATATDAAGNGGPAGTAVAFTIDTTPPNPTTSLGLSPLDDSGTLGDQRTNVVRPRLTGQSEPGAFVAVRDGLGSILETAFADGTGQFSVLLINSLPDGQYPFTATATDAAGNLGSASLDVSVTIDTTPPQAPSPPDLAPVDDSGVVGDRLTRVAQPSFVGTSEPGARIQIRDGSQTLVAQGTADSSGGYLLRSLFALSEGSIALSAVAVDAAGNQGQASRTTITVDLTAPPAPSLPSLLTADDSGILGDGRTNIARPRLFGSGEPLASVLLKDDRGTMLASAIADGTGSYLADFLAAPGEGTYRLTPFAVDRAGNAGPAGPSLTLTIDRTAPSRPATPTLLPADDSGIAGDLITSVATPRLVGKTEALAKILLLDDVGNTLATSSADASDNFSLAPATKLKDGPASLRVMAEDAAGNRSAASPALTATIDTTAPAVPPAPGLATAGDSGVQGDSITNVKTPAIVGLTEPLAAVQLQDGTGATLATGSADASGAYRLVPSRALADGPVLLRILATDAGGNTSKLGTGSLLKIDTSPPSSPTLLGLSPADDSGVQGDGITSNRRPRLIGKGEPGSTIRLNGANGTVLVGPDGSFACPVSAGLDDGVYSLTASATDIAGNTSSLSNTFTLTIDAAPPPGPSFTMFRADDTGVTGDNVTAVKRPRLVGSTSPGALVEIVDGSGAVLGSGTASGDGSFSVAPASDLNLGMSSLSIRVRDLAGNQGSAGPASNIRRIAVWGDFDGIGAAQLGVYSAATATSLIGAAGTSGRSLSFGKPKVDIPVPADYDGDGKTDVSVYRTTTGEWITQRSSDQGVTTRPVGKPKLDLPVPGDYDGDGISDFATYRPSAGQWSINLSKSGRLQTVSLGTANVDLPVPADYDGDGKTDVAAYRPSTGLWTILNSSDGSRRTVTLGKGNLDLPIPADYDGDGKADFAVYRPTTAQWLIQASSTGQTSTNVLGTPNGSVPIPADYEGIGRAQIAAYRSSAAEFLLLPSSGGAPRRFVFGKSGGSALLRAAVTRLKGLKPTLGPP